MSSFIVEPKTINRIVSWIEKEYFSDSIISSEVKNCLNENNIFLEQNEISLDDLANLFLCLNKLATDCRYDTNHLVLRQKYEYEPSTEIQVLKSMRCLSYQASEGNYPENKIYKMLSRLIEILTDKIINDLPEYEKAEWG